MRARAATVVPQKFPGFLSLVFILCMAVLAGGAYYFSVNMGALSNATREAQRSTAVIRSLSALDSRLFSAEAGYRGYLTSGKAEFLAPYHRARESYKNELRDARNHLAANPAQQQRLTALEGIIDRKFEQMRARIQQREEAGRPDDGAGFIQDTELLDQAAAGLEDLRREQLGAFNAATQDSERSLLHALIYAFGSSALAIFGLTGFYILTRRFFFERDASETALRASEKEFRAMFDMAAVGMVECVASTGSIVIANSKFSAMLGYAMGELEHMIFFHLLHPSDNGAGADNGAGGGGDRESYEHMIRGETAEWVVERRCVKRDGQSIWVRASFSLIVDRNGAPLRTVGIIEDIDERKRIEAELRDNAAILSTVSEDTTDLICVKDIDGRLEMANPAYVRLLGRPREDIIGRMDIDLLDDPAQAKAIRECDRRVTQKRQTQHVDEVVTIGGKTHTFLSTKVPRYDANGQVTGLIVVSRDITERKQAEEVLRNTRDYLVREVNKRTEALSNLSRNLIRVSEEEKASLARELHDEVGSSLAAISMDMGWILNKLKQEKPELAARQERALAGIHAALDIKRRIVDGLRPLALEHFGLEVALRSHCDAFSEHSGLSVEMNAPEEMLPPDPDTSLVIFRVVQECLTNISKHADAKNVTVDLEESREGILVRVTDDGKGIPPDLMNRPGAHGILGMRERVAHLGGSLAVEPGPDGKGTVVEVRMPLDQDTTPQRESSTEAL